MTFRSFIAITAFGIASMQANAATFLSATVQADDPTVAHPFVGPVSISASAPEYTIEPLAASIRDRRVADIAIRKGPEVFQLSIWSANGQQLGVGSYTVFPFVRSPVGEISSGLSFFQTDRCLARGRFTVREITRAPDGTLTSLAVDFEQHCKPYNAGTFGGLRYNSSVPYAPPALPAYATQVARVNLPATYPLAVGQPLTGLGVATLDEGGNRVGSQEIEFEIWCDNHPLVAERLLSNSQGFIGLPPWWTGPPAGAQRCDAFVSVAKLPAAVEYHSEIPVSTGPRPLTRTLNGWSPANSPVSLSIAAGPSGCEFNQVSFSFHDGLTPASPPTLGLVTPEGLLIADTVNCRGSPVTFRFTAPQSIPATTQWWNWGATPAVPVSHWYPVESTVDGNTITFSMADGAYVDLQDSVISFIGAPAVPGGTTQDLWWSGLAENGWGMSIVQHRDILFTNFFVYDDQGKPVWYVMPGGTWTAAKTYTGALYLPKGSPFFAYDVAKFDVGTSVGTATLTFASANQATLEYTIKGATGRKEISRLAFGPRVTPYDKFPVADLWWGGISDLWWGGTAQNGWGIALLQQYASLFALWYTYDANGSATWFVMPAGSWTSDDEWSGKTYRADGSAWLGAQYDPSRHHVTENGSFRLKFYSAFRDKATFDYTVDGKSGTVTLSRIPF